MKPFSLSSLLSRIAHKYKKLQTPLYTTKDGRMVVKVNRIGGESTLAEVLKYNGEWFSQPPAMVFSTNVFIANFRPTSRR